LIFFNSQEAGRRPRLVRDEVTSWSTARCLFGLGFGTRWWYGPNDFVVLLLVAGTYCCLCGQMWLWRSGDRRILEHQVWVSTPGTFQQNTRLLCDVIFERNDFDFLRDWIFSKKDYEYLSPFLERAVFSQIPCCWRER
jgi:hypothetical protein